MKRSSLLVVVIALATAVFTTAWSSKRSDRELAQMLVKLELRTRGVIAKRYVAADIGHRKWLADHLLLPAAIADEIFNDVVPEATGNRAWVKMIVDEPRNPHNAGDETAISLFNEIRDKKAANGERRVKGAYYYGQPIKAAKGCLLCHGAPEGAPDPMFPQYRKNGWKEGDIVGAVISRVK